MRCVIEFMLGLPDYQDYQVRHRWDREIGKRDVAEEGETVTIQGWPARNGSDSMVLSSIVSPKHGKTVVVDRIKQERAREDIPAVTVKRN